MSIRNIEIRRERRARRPRHVVGLAALVLVMGLLAACSSEASTRAGADGGDAGATAPPASVPTEIPPGTTLRVGDQVDYLQTILELAGEDQGFAYTVEYAAFVGGPPMLQAFQAGALDVGYVGSTPLIFAQAARQPLVAVGGWANPNGGYDLLTAPGDTSVTGWADLAGKRVAYQEGTALQAAVIQGLASVGLGVEDITPVNLPLTQATSALQSGSADVAVSIEPLTSAYLTGAPGGQVAFKATEITDRSSFLIATEDTLGDDARAAALADYLGRLVRALEKLQDDPSEIATAIYVEQYGLSQERAEELVAEQGVASFYELPGEILPQQQVLADLLFENDVIPVEVDAAEQFDTRFNQIVVDAKGVG